MYPLVMTNIAIEHDHRNSGFFPIEHGGSFHSYVNVYQRVNGAKMGRHRRDPLLL